MNFFNLVKQDVKNIITNKTILLFCIVYPSFLIVMFGFLFSDVYRSETVTSYDYYGVTMICYLSLQAATITPTVFMEERIKKANMRIAFSPVTRTEIYASKLLTTFIFLETAFIIQMIILNATGLVNYGGENFGIILMLITVLLAFSISLGGAICTIVKSEDLTNKIVGITINSVAIFSGVFFPIAKLGTFADNVSNFLPAKMILNTAFQVIYDNSLSRFCNYNRDKFSFYNNFFSNNS